MRRKRLALTLALLLAMSGCGANVDISKRSIVTAVAVGLREEGGYEIMVEYLNRIGGESQSYQTSRGQGDTFAQAVMDMELVTGKTLYLDGCKVLLVDGVKNSRELRELLEEVDAHGGIRPLTLVAVSPQSPGLLEGKPREEDSAGEETFALLTAGELARVNLKDCLNLLATPGRGLMLPVVERREEQASVSGYLAVGETALIQAPSELARLLPFAAPGRSGETVRTISGDGYSVDWVLEKNRLRIRPGTESGKLSFSLEAEVEGYILSFRGEEKGEELLASAQEAICSQMLEEYVLVLEKIVRASGSDLFSLGKRVEIFLPDIWEKVEKDWPRRLSEAGIQIQGSVLLRDKKRVLELG
jgi:hypothetical protein